MKKTIGILGVGELTEKLVMGLIKGTPEQKIVLSPRSSDRVNLLLHNTECSAGKSNQDVVNQADIVIIGVRPDSLQQLAEEVSLRPDQLLISIVAGVKREQLQRVFNHPNVARMMLTYAAKINRTTVVLTPENASTEHYFSCLGEVIMISEEHNFELSTVGMCMNGWFYEFAGQLQNWIIEKGMDLKTQDALCWEQCVIAQNMAVIALINLYSTLRNLSLRRGPSPVRGRQY